MQVLRIYTGDDDRSHFEELDIPLKDAAYGSFSRFIPLKGIIFREVPLSLSIDFHTAPQRQFVVTLTGRVEIECGDGTKRLFGPGDILLADDTTGQGHISRDLEGPRKVLFLPLADGVDTSVWKK